MLKKHKYDIIVLLAVLGLGISLYLAITHYLGFTVPCNVTHGCEVVLNSKYASLFGIPLSVFGVAYFAAIIICALLANHYALSRRLLTILVSLGALSALGLLSIQFFILKKVCQYCLATDLLNIFLFILDINIERKQENLPQIT